MIKRGGYGKKLKYRLGFWPLCSRTKFKRKRIWIQAVSVGELSSINSMLQSFIADPKIEIVLSGTTSTGQKIAEQKHAKEVLASGPFPLDWFPFSCLSWSRINPILPYVWIASFGPNICIRQKRRGIPFFIINGQACRIDLYHRLRTVGHFPKFIDSKELTDPRIF